MLANKKPGVNNVRRRMPHCIVLSIDPQWYEIAKPAAASPLKKAKNNFKTNCPIEKEADVRH
jgi:hypothetical protein